MIPPRVLLVLDGLDRAGTERHVLWLGAGLRSLGWDVHVAATRDGPMRAAMEAAGLSLHRVRRAGRRDPLYPLRIARLARRIGLAVLHTHCGRLAALGGHLARVPAIVDTRHGLGDVGEPPDPRRLRDEARRARLAHVTIAVCEAERERLRRGGLPEERVRLVRNGIPLRDPPAVALPAALPVAMPVAASVAPSAALPPGGAGETSGGPLRLGFLGRLAPEKDPLLLAAIASALLVRTRLPWTLAVAGGGSLAPALEAGVRGLGAAAGERVRLLGEIPDPAPFLAAIDLLLLPSLREGQPLIVLEAMERGIVPLVRAIPSLVELVGGSPPCGLALPGNAEAWADAIAGLAERPDEMRRLGEEGRRRVRAHHRIEAQVGAVDRVYRDLFASRGVGLLASAASRSISGARHRERTDSG
ncbi:MAG: glycosyltransferase [Candidatus Eisenbacteria bacterium]